jgi:CheY-like chemotaxis protein
MKGARFVLIAEMDPDSRLIYQEVIAATGVQVDYQFVSGRLELLAFLRDESKPRPCLIIAGDLPAGNHLDFEELMKDEKTRSIPLVIIASEESEAAARKAYADCANSYIIQPAGFQPFVDAMRTIFKYWFETAVSC